MKMIFITLIIICILLWLASIPVWTIKRNTDGENRDFKINTYQKIRGLDY
jgi:hypothetical protein